MIKDKDNKSFVKQLKSMCFQLGSVMRIGQLQQISRCLGDHLGAKQFLAYGLQWDEAELKQN